MSQESLSALLDGECSAAELDRLLDEIERSPELKAAYSRLCQAREVGEGTRITKGQPCICADVMSRVAKEPMVEVSAKVADLDSRRRWAPVFRSWGGMAAAAATVAAVAVLVAMPGLKPVQTGDTPMLASEGSAPVNFVPAAVPVSRPSRYQRAVALTPEQAEQFEELNSLMLTHNSSMAEQGVGGTLRHARAAAHAMPAVYRTESAGDGR